MLNTIFYVFFLIVSVFILMKTIGYAIYEINTQKNKSGGIVVICFSTLVVIFSNLMVYLGTRLTLNFVKERDTSVVENGR